MSRPSFPRQTDLRYKDERRAGVKGRRRQSQPAAPKQQRKPISRGNYTYRRVAKAQYGQRSVGVCSFAASPGLHDMHSSVWEWVEDCLHNSHTVAPSDGSAWTTACPDASRRAALGGSWGGRPEDLRSANRSGITGAVQDGGRVNVIQTGDVSGRLSPYKIFDGLRTALSTVFMAQECASPAIEFR